MKIGTTIALAGIAAVALCGSPAQAQNGRSLNAYLRSLPLQTIDANERADLEAMRQEEKFARDVYLVLDMVWGIPIFANIAQSEQSHMDLVKWALDRYGIADPLPNENIGVFGDPFFASLFVGVATFGLQSPLHALIAGALIEDIDLVDLQRALTRTDNRDVGTVWQNLYRGSRNHLRSFHAQLDRSGYVYYPIFLTLTEYVAITTSAHEPFPVDENGDPLR